MAGQSREEELLLALKQAMESIATSNLVFFQLEARKDSTSTVN